MTSTTTNSRTSSQKPFSTCGNASLNALAEKNVSRTLDQPGLVTTSAVSSPSTSTVEPAESAAPRRARRRRAASRTARRSPGALTASVQLGRAGGRAHPALRDALQLAGRPQLLDRAADARRELGALGQQRAPRVPTRRGELPDDARPLDLRGGQVE